MLGPSNFFWPILYATFLIKRASGCTFCGSETAWRGPARLSQCFVASRTQSPYQNLTLPQPHTFSCRPDHKRWARPESRRTTDIQQRSHGRHVRAGRAFPFRKSARWLPLTSKTSARWLPFSTVRTRNSGLRCQSDQSPSRWMILGCRGSA